MLKKNVKIVFSAFRCSAEDVSFVTFLAYEQAMVFENSVISLELTNYVLYVILHLAFFTTDCYICNCRMRGILPCKITQQIHNFYSAENALFFRMMVCIVLFPFRQVVSAQFSG